MDADCREQTGFMPNTLALPSQINQRCKEQTEVIPLQVEIFKFSSEDDPSFFSLGMIYSLAFYIKFSVPFLTLQIDKQAQVSMQDCKKLDNR
jgi:hypothetical protein